MGDKDLAQWLAERLEPIPEDHDTTTFWREVLESCGVFRSPGGFWEAQDDDMSVDPWPAPLNGNLAVAVVEAMAKLGWAARTTTYQDTMSACSFSMVKGPTFEVSEQHSLPRAICRAAKRALKVHG